MKIDRTDRSIVLVGDGCIIDPKATLALKDGSTYADGDIDRCEVISIGTTIAYCHYKDSFFYVDIKYLETVVRLNAFN